MMEGDRVSDLIDHPDGELFRVSISTTWLERHTTIILFSIIGVFILLCWLVDYRDTVSAPATLTSTNAPKKIVVRKDGKLVKMCYQNDARVKNGQILGWIESNADVNEVLLLSAKLDSVVPTLFASHEHSLETLFGYRFTDLGELQGLYGELRMKVLEQQEYLPSGYYSFKEQVIGNELVALKDFKRLTAEQDSLATADIRLARQEFEMQQQLYVDRVISEQEYRRQLSAYLNKSQLLPQIRRAGVQLENDQLHRQLESRDIKHEHDKLKIDVQRGILQLDAAVKQWKQTYLILAPCDGVISYSRFVEENEYLRAGEVWGYVLPYDNRLYFSLNLAQENYGRIDTGETVHIRLKAYPYKDFGELSGKISYVSKIATDSGLLCTIETPGELITDKGIQIPFRDNLKSEALFRMKSKTILSRMLEPLKMQRRRD